jgi:hypothetical protein
MMRKTCDKIKFTDGGLVVSCFNIIDGYIFLVGETEALAKVIEDKGYVVLVERITV